MQKSNMEVLPVAITQLHQSQTVMHAADWLFLDPRNEYSIVAFSDLQILVGRLQQVLQQQLLKTILGTAWPQEAIIVSQQSA